ncbi:probable leucine-rich repeat receptor-like protein kinase [Tanacetum coccineum]
MDCAFRQKGRAERATNESSTFALWDANNGSGAIPQLKGAKAFTFAEVNKYTNKFSETNNIGTGGYGMVVASMDWPQVTKYKALVSAMELARDSSMRCCCMKWTRSASWLIHPCLSFTGRKLHATCNIRCGSEEASYSFLPGDRGSTDKSGNVLPGTVLDTKICHPTEFDFYCVVMLVSSLTKLLDVLKKTTRDGEPMLPKTVAEVKWIEVKDCISRTCSRSKLIEYAEEVSPLCTKVLAGLGWVWPGLTGFGPV